MIGRVVCILVAASMALGDELPYEKKLREVAAAHPGLVELSSLGKSRLGRDLPVARVGPKGEFPSLVIVAGINGMHRVGMDVAVGLADTLAGAEALKGTTVFIVPCLNPDTFSWHLDKGHPKTDWSRTIVPLDADRDGRVNEDPAEDLNEDGVISMMRIKDPKAGSGLKAEYCVDPENPKLLKKPDAAKGERAEYALLVEGTDNDGDGKFNEDGVGGAGGGVDLDLNFPARWQEQWTDGAGRFALCEPESRALADWMLKQRNVAAVLVFGPADTLVSIPQAGKFDQTGQVPLGIEEGDKAAYEMVSKLFKEATNQTGAPAAEMTGSFWAWAYSQYGVPTFETPVWVRPDQVKKPDEPKKEPEGEKKDGEGGAPPPTPAPGAAAGEPTEAEVRARMQEFRDATPERRQQMMQEFQNLPAEVRERLQVRFAGALAPGGAGGAQPERPGGTPPVGGGRGGRGGRGGGRGPGGAGEAAPAGEAGAKKAGEPSGEDAKWLKYDDEQVKAGAESGYLDWKPFTHAQFGDVEIGGFVPGFKLNPPDSELPRLAAEQAKFIEALCAKFPKIEADAVTVASAGTGLWRICLRATNTGALASMAAIGAKVRREVPTILAIDVPLDRIVAGEKLVRAWSLPGSGGQAEAEWLVTGDAGSTVNVEVRPTLGPKVVIAVKLEEARR